MAMLYHRKLRALGRREMIKTTLRWTMLTGSPASLTALAAGKSPSAPDEPPPLHPPDGSASTIDADAFVRVSQYLTETSSLNRDVAAKILATFTGETQNRSLLVQLTKEVDSIPSMDQKPTISPTQFLRTHTSLAPLVGEILTAWYLGMRMMGEKAYFFTYFDALIFQTTNSLRTTPGTCGGPTHFWSEPPQLRG